MNAAVAVDTGESPEALLKTLHRIEATFGRTRERRWGARTLDLDLLALGDNVLPDAETFHAWRTMPLEEQQVRVPESLILPHPRMQDRAFVLVPLAETAPDCRHPVLEKTVRDMLDALPREDLAGIDRIGAL